MYKPLSPVIATAVVLAVASSIGATAAPFDSKPHFGTVWIKGNAFSNATVVVMMRGDDPRRAVKELVPQEITIEGDYHADMSKGYITSVDIGHRVERGNNVINAWIPTGENPPNWTPPESSSGSFSYSVSTADLPSIIRQGMIDACTTPGAASFAFPVHMQVTARRYKRGNTSANKRADWFGSGVMPIKVICQQEAKAEAPPEPVSVVIGVRQIGEVCPKETEVTALIHYDAPAVAHFRFKLDGELSGLYTRKAVALEPDRPGPPPRGKSRKEGRYLVQETKTYYVDPGQHHFRIEVRGGAKSEVKTVRIECPPFKVTSAWLDYDIEDKPNCPKEVVEEATFRSTRPGKAPFEIKTQGGLVVHSGTAVFERKGKGYVAKVARDLVLNAFDQDMMALIKNQPDANSGWTRLKVDCMEVLSGTLDLREFAATQCKGEAALSIRANMPGKVPYRLDCTGNRSWTGTANVQQTAPGTLIGVDVHRFDVWNNEQVNCALKTDAPFPVRILQLKGHKYQCHKPSGASGTSDLAPPSRPDDPPPPGQTLKGDFSFVDTGGTKCPRQGKALINFTTGQPQNVHYSLDCTNGSFSGVAQTAKSPKGGYVAPALVSFDIKQTTQANCVLKTVAPGNPKVHTLKGHLFQCVKPTGVSGTSDLTPPSPPDPAPGGPKVVVDPPRTPQPKISCAGGKVQYGKCACERGFNAVATGKNAFRCVQTATLPPVNPSAPTRTTPTPPAPKVACLGGAVRNGQCLCPAGTAKQTVGNNAWRCAQTVKLQFTPPTKGCPPGQKPVNGRCIKPAG